MSETAKILDIPGLGRNNLYRFLRARGILNAKNLPRNAYVQLGYFEANHSPYVIDIDGRLIQSGPNKIIRVTRQGIEFIRFLLLN